MINNYKVNKMFNFNKRVTSKYLSYEEAFIGGNVNCAIDMLSHLINKKQILTLDYKRYKIEYYTKDMIPCFEKIVLIVNENTLSAAEIFAYSLLENCSNCIALGNNTYGKQYGQTSLMIRKKNRLLRKLNKRQFKVV